MDKVSVFEGSRQGSIMHPHFHGVGARFEGNDQAPFRITSLDPFDGAANRSRVMGKIVVDGDRTHGRRLLQASFYALESSQRRHGLVERHAHIASGSNRCNRILEVVGTV